MIERYFGIVAWLLLVAHTGAGQVIRIVSARSAARRAYVPTLLRYDAYMGRQMTIRGVSEEIGQRLESLSRARLLGSAVGVEERRRRLARYSTWTQEDLEEFNEALSAQRNLR